jgi:Siphovirus Gp157
MSIHEQISIANAIREQLASMQIEDEGLIHDTIDGECDIFQCIDWLLNKLADDDCSLDALDVHISKLKARKERVETRKERWRELLLMAAQATGEKSIKRPCGTVSVSNKAIGIASIDEALVPNDYFTVETIRKLDRAKLKAAAIEHGVAGCVLDNGGVTLRVRV